MKNLFNDRTATWWNVSYFETAGTYVNTQSLLTLDNGFFGNPGN